MIDEKTIIWHNWSGDMEDKWIEEHASLWNSSVGMINNPKYSDSILFIEKAVYDHLFLCKLFILIFYVSKNEYEYEIIEKLLHCSLSRRTNRLPESAKMGVSNNRYFCIHALNDVLGRNSIQEIKIGTKGNICNPSILYTNGKYYLNIREVNYTIDKDGRYHPPNNYYQSINHFFELDDIHDLDLATKQSTKIPTTRNFKTYSFDVEGFEDIRLIEYEGSIWGLASSKYTNPDGMNEMVMVPMPSCKRIIRLKGYNDSKPQKNWIPILDSFVSERNKIKISLLYDSSTRLTFYKENISVDHIDQDYFFNDYTFYKENISVDHIDQDYLFNNYRGSSQAIKWDDNGYLYLIHEVLYLGEKKYYFHRFVQTNCDAKIIQISHSFYFIQKGIEFVCGMCLDPNQHLLITFGVNDRRAFVLRVHPDEVRKMLCLLPFHSIK